jgi:hypothetical protein
MAPELDSKHTNAASQEQRFIRKSLVATQKSNRGKPIASSVTFGIERTVATTELFVFRLTICKYGLAPLLRLTQVAYLSPRFQVSQLVFSGFCNQRVRVWRFYSHGSAATA